MPFIFFGQCPPLSEHRFRLLPGCRWPAGAAFGGSLHGHRAKSTDHPRRVAIDHPSPPGPGPGVESYDANGHSLNRKKIHGIWRFFSVVVGNSGKLMNAKAGKSFEGVAFLSGLATKDLSPNQSVHTFCTSFLGGSWRGGGVHLFPVFTLLGNPLHMDLRNAYMYSFSHHFTV